MNSKKSFIEISQISMHYTDPASDLRFQALRGIDLNISQGSFEAIIGPSGAGKSTLLNIIGGMIKPSTGSIHVDNYPLHLLTGEDLNLYRRYTTGFLWQLPQKNLLPRLTAIENVLFAMTISNFPRTQRIKRAKELLKAVGLQNRENHTMNQLSGGEAQRTGIAVALANNPKLLLADEPTGELDSETTLDIISYLQELNKDLGLTIVVVTHDKRFERVTKRAYNILDGVIAGVRRPKNGEFSSDWKSAVREEVGLVNQYGMIRIPSNLRKKYKINEFVKFEEDPENMRIYLQPADEQEEG